MGTGRDKTIVERRTGTEVYRSGTKFSTKVMIVIAIFIAVGIVVNVFHIFGH